MRQQTNNLSKKRYDKLLNETRTQQKHWYISIDEYSRVEYTLQSDDEQNIRLVHLFGPDSYYFVNLTGVYSYDEYKALERVILDVECIKAYLSKDERKGKSASQSIKKRKDAVVKVRR